MSANFDPKQHQMPRYDIFGAQKRQYNPVNETTENILSKNIRIPEAWSNESLEKNKTRKELIQNRKKANVPDLSYDLDNDGMVCAREYFIARRFDGNADGKLEPEERKAAIQALQEGYESKFYWGIEKSGALRGKRLLQVRGKIVDAEDFASVRETYPAHPISLNKSMVETRTELKMKRKCELMYFFSINTSQNSDDMKANKDAWDKANPSRAPQRFIASEFLVNVPAHVSRSQIKQEKKENARVSAGLLAHSTDLKEKSKDPSLSFVYNPQVKTQKELFEKIRNNNLEDLSKFGKRHPLNEVERLQAREDCIIREGHKCSKRMTYRDLAERRRKEMVDYNMKTFGNVAIGIHGKELPKFADRPETQEYWKFRNSSYVERPSNQSRTKMIRSQMYWAKPDDMLLNSVTNEEGPRDPFKTAYVPRTRKREICEKINNVNLFTKEANDSPSTVKKRDARWSSTVQKFSQKQKGVYEEDPNNRSSLLKKEVEPLYSSFNPNNVFVDPNTKLKQTNRTRSKSMEKSQRKTTTKQLVGALRGPNESLLTRVTMKKSVGTVPDIDTKKVIAMGVRTGGF